MSSPNVLEITQERFPTTRYQGSKRKILPWIYSCLKDVDFNTVLDAFGGSGAVSYMFKQMGKGVTYNDLYHFNHYIGESIIENSEVLLTEADILFLLAPQTIGRHFIEETFRGVYFLEEENRWLDMVINNIEHLADSYSGSVLKFKKAIAYNALFQSCLSKRPYNMFHRKNLEMRIRNVERHFGNKTTWDRPFPDHFIGFVAEINRAVFTPITRCEATCNDVFAIKDVDYDLVYLDPPYIVNTGKNESSDYLRCYHFLEGIAHYDQWDSLMDKETINKRIKRSYAQNPFVPKDALETFDRLIYKFRNSIIVLSYRNGGIPTIEDLSRMILKYKGHIDVHDRHYTYALNKQNGNALLNREYLLIGY